MKRRFEMYIEKYWGDYVGGTDESLTVPITENLWMDKRLLNLQDIEKM